ncbi:zinc finger MYM-type protein 2 isoform X2 [Polyodon spathula]|uniref:zinc finger MYM-type protein 2 isoform X2 n=1 Tax=Polyodon spathula TaxID=7913 RepID=UPI001B7EA488|nr:zinc finger MYM-type protein 2 isoform X2 [Polyodon spathula]
MDRGFVESLESKSISEGNRTSEAGSIMATGLSGVGSAFEGQSLKLVTNEFPHTATTDDDDDVVFVELSPSAQNSTPTPLPTHTAPPAPPAPQPPLEVFPRAETTKILSHPKEPVAPSVDSLAEPIVIDDEEDADLEQSVTHVSSKGPLPEPNGTSKMDIMGSSSNKLGSLLTHTVISTEPDSEIKIANVTTLDMASMLTSSVQGPLASAVTTEGPLDMNLMITSVTSLQNASLREVGNGPQISSTFSLNPEVQSAPGTTHADVNRPGVHSGAGTFNPGRIGTTGEAVQNGESGTHQRPDSWISQSASFPRNQKQPGDDSMSPAASLPKSVFQTPASQQPAKPVKVTCANCKKPLRKGQTAYQRKGSAHLFCSTTCLSAFSHKPAPKKNCTMCKKDITSMKGTIVAQVDSSESFQEFCSPTCLSSYENKQNPAKPSVKTRCTVCGKLTEIRHEVSFKNVTHKICSDHCFNRYRMANGLIMNCCEQCGEHLQTKSAANHFLIIDGQRKRFCCQNCVKDYKQAHGKITCCTGCRTPCRFFDITHCIGPNGNMEPYCSTACMNSHKSKNSRPAGTAPTCHFCKRSALPQFQATMPDGKLYNFCSSDCVAKFQAIGVQSSTNGQTTPPQHDIHLKCNYCKGLFSVKPETLEWEDKVYQFCSKTCCEDYKKLHCIVTYCEYCQEEKTLHETVKFSGVKKPFCSEGCKLLFKQEFARRLGLKCVSCNYCSQMCKRAATKEIGGVIRDFCSEACSKKFTDWYNKAARCDCCKVQGHLTESVQWRAEMKRFCDQQCLLRFYCQQNVPNMSTQRGPENMCFGQGNQTGSKTTILHHTSSVSSHSTSPLKDMKNKSILCKPLTMTKATYCKPHMQTKSCQTEEEVKTKYVPVPIPVPVYIPVPVHLYSQNTPVPLALPVPVPVPVFLPTTLDSAEKIVQTIDELRAKIPSDPLEADILAMAEMIAEADEKQDYASISYPRTLSTDAKSEVDGTGEEVMSTSTDNLYEPELDLETDFAKVAEELKSEIAFMLPQVLGEENEEKEEKPRPQVKKKGRKRGAVLCSNSQVGKLDTPESGFAMKSTYGINAWKQWILTQNEADKDKEQKGEVKHAKPVRLKMDLLSHTAAELNYGLSRFVHEVRRPNRECYSPDSIYYLCLGIQQHLNVHGRADNIFSDPYYQMFGQELNKILKDWHPSVLPDGSTFSRIEEEYLWSCKQFGEHSPMVLLSTLVYFNTKYFGLRTVDQHLRLSFGNVFRQWRKNPHTKESTVCIRVHSVSEDLDKSATRKRKHKDDEDPDYEPEGNSGSLSWCPAKKRESYLYELYLSKCPESLKPRMDLFYMKPESSSSPDSPLWYTTTSLDRNTLESLLTRILLIRDIYDERDTSLDEED